MKTVYLLPCSCGRELEVDVAQAGSDVVCECGNSVVVPTIRQLKQLKQSQSQRQNTPVKVSGWTAAHGAAFSLGLLVAIVALVFAGYNGYVFWGTQKMRDPVADAISDINHEVNSWTPEVALGFFRNEEAAGLGIPHPPFWAEIDKVNAAAKWRTIGGIIVAGVGLLAAAGALTFRSKPR
jgi:hypothetical protein